jgi:hypothetical protein
MIVYRTGAKEAQQAVFLMTVCPARHLEGQEMPHEWVNEKNEPIDMKVEFNYGRAEVPKQLGEYLIKYGLASRTKLITAINTALA